jgi:membrane fusion protein
MRTTLFRQDALEFNRQKMLGDAVPIGPLSLKFLAATACGVAASIIAFACWAQYTPKVRVSGYLAPSGGLIKILAAQTGTLVDQRVSEGQKVRQGDTLFVLSTEESSPQDPHAQAAAIETIEQRLASLHREITTERRIDDAQASGTRRQISDTQAELTLLQSEIATQTQRVDSAESKFTRLQSLLPQGFVSQAQVQQQHDEVLEQRTRLQELKRTGAGLQRDIDNLARELGTGELQNINQRETAEREASALQQQLTEYQARRTIVITAPADGVATAILGAKGQRTSPQMLLLTILPTGARLEAHLLVPSRAIGFVAVGERVALRLQPFPYQQFGSPKGRVTEVSRTVVAPSDAASPVVTLEAVYRVVVALDSELMHTRNRDISLQPGMLLDADICLERRRIIRWLSDPLATAVGEART